ncbi:hypothetical protein AXF42_Ash021605 [Apostasia shenzhenica]|uniref:Uncharacterized protein n=1 Tax=Apostasia shenzhenica TaxID=1088818 RepID=A0A2H9ZRV4_9ASPA|nr:hypothetical protein AXF42_Ash021605 [Apostasia shenzhenica]
MPDRVTHFFLSAISLTNYSLSQKLRGWRKRIQLSGRRPHLILTGLGHASTTATVRIPGPILIFAP